MRTNASRRHETPLRGEIPSRRHVAISLRRNEFSQVVPTVCGGAMLRSGIEAMATRRTPGSTNTSPESYPKLISLAVHELRTPASVVGGYLRMLQREGEAALSPRQLKMVDEAAKSCARIVALIAELGDIGKMDAGL